MLDTDKRWKQFGEVLVNYCMEVQKGQKVVMQGSFVSRPVCGEFNAASRKKSSIVPVIVFIKGLLYIGRGGWFYPRTPFTSDK